MRILVLWRQGSLEMRKTFQDHIFSFRKYDLSNEYFYFNVYNGRYKRDYAWIKEGMFDAVIFHYTAFEIKWSDVNWDPFVDLMESIWKNYDCEKILIPQDDYSCTKKIWQLIKAIDATHIFTTIRKQDYEIIYPKSEIGRCKLHMVYTGYVDAKTVESLQLIPHRKRDKDIVYRANKLSYAFGKHGQIKSEIIDVFRPKIEKAGLKSDLGSTFNNQGAILGDAWFDFLINSRCTIGVLGGSSIVDYDGHIIKEMEIYQKQHPNETYEEVKSKKFPNVPENLHGVLSPRLFECAMTKTCQILVGNDFQGVLEPNVDYILLDEDYGNIDEVIEKIRDVDYCEKIAECCYEHVILSKKYEYRVFVEQIVNEIQLVNETKRDANISQYIQSNCEKNNTQAYADLVKRLKEK